MRTVVFSVSVVIATLTLSQNNASAGVLAPLNFSETGSGSASGSGWVAGGHAGYNWQQGAAVFGFETDLQGTNLGVAVKPRLTSNFLFLPPPPSDVAAAGSAIDWY